MCRSCMLHSLVPIFNVQFYFRFDTLHIFPFYGQSEVTLVIIHLRLVILLSGQGFLSNKIIIPSWVDFYKSCSIFIILLEFQGPSGPSF